MDGLGLPFALVRTVTRATVPVDDKFIPIVKNAFELMGNALEADSKEVSEISKNFLNSLPIDMEEKIGQFNAAITGIYEKVLPEDLRNDLEENANE